MYLHYFQFDVIIITCGASVQNLWETTSQKSLPIQLVRGQSLLYDVNVINETDENECNNHQIKDKESTHR